jgi:hypothetical protein
MTSGMIRLPYLWLNADDTLGACVVHRSNLLRLIRTDVRTLLRFLRESAAASPLVEECVGRCARKASPLARRQRRRPYPLSRLKGDHSSLGLVCGSMTSRHALYSNSKHSSAGLYGVVIGQEGSDCPLGIGGLGRSPSFFIGTLPGRVTDALLSSTPSGFLGGLFDGVRHSQRLSGPPAGLGLIDRVGAGAAGIRTTLSDCQPLEFGRAEMLRALDEPSLRTSAPYRPKTRCAGWSWRTMISCRKPP